MNRRSALWLLGGSLGMMSRGVACLWDTDTLKEELKRQESMFDLVIGQFPHHGDAYYYVRLARMRKRKSPTVIQLNDMAVANVRLKDYATAEKLLQRAIKLKPGHYETLSNMGVTAKKSGDFSRGADFIEKALAIKAGGHMGLGNWYLRALRWRAIYEIKGASEPIINFLGKPYTETFKSAIYGSNNLPNPINMDMSKYGMLLKNDQSFSDGFLLVGDYLNHKGSLHLSFLAHTRAMMLGHQNPEEIRRRRRAYLQYFKMFGAKPSGRKKIRNDKPWAHEIARAEALINKGAKWLDEFKAMEAKLLKGKSDERKITFAIVEKALLKAGIKKVRGI